jgi:hypothetical protein
MPEQTCNICSTEYSDDEGGVQGHFGMLPVSFCPTCFSSACDMAIQFVEPNLELEEELKFLRETNSVLTQVNQDLKFQLVEKDAVIQQLQSGE